MNWRQYLGQAVFGGSASCCGLLAYELFHSHPEMVIDTFRSWGPLSVVCIVGLVMVDRGFNNMVAAARESSAAQQKLADAVNQIATRDNYETEQQRILLAHVGTTMEKVLSRLESIEVNTKGAAASA